MSGCSSATESREVCQSRVIYSLLSAIPFALALIAYKGYFGVVPPAIGGPSGVLAAGIALGIILPVAVYCCCGYKLEGY